MIDTKAIRAQILRLAFSAQLTAHNDDDDDVTELLSSINPKKNIEQTEDIPYEIPDYWKWVKLSDLYEINPKVEADNEADAAFIPMEKISAGFERSFSFEVMNWEKAAKNHTKFQDGDVAFAKISPCFENRKSFVAENLPNSIGGGTTELIVLRQKYVYPLYTYYLVNDQRFIKAGSVSYKGIVGQQRVKSDIIKNYLIPLPPLAEQKRIVERVEEIFRLFDTIDQAQEKYSADSQILKAKLITAGIQGKLTKQLPSDGTAEELYQQIQAEKQKLIKEGKLKKEKPLPPVSPEEVPFEIPENWMWVRLGDITTKITSGSTPPGGKKGNSYVPQGFCFFREQNIYNDGIRHDGMVFINEELLNTRQNSTVIANDILLNITGGSIGRCAIIPSDFDRGSINQHILIIRLVDTNMRYYIHQIICSPYVQKLIKSKAVGDKDGFSGGRCKATLIPLPPLAEQKRIADVLEKALGALDKV